MSPALRAGAVLAVIAGLLAGPLAGPAFAVVRRTAGAGLFLAGLGMVAALAVGRLRRPAPVKPHPRERIASGASAHGSWAAGDNSRDGSDRSAPHDLRAQHP